MALLATHALTKRYGHTLALDGLELDLPEGGIFGFLGPNGSGKTTTIRLLLGLLRPSSGAARIFGRDCWHDGAAIRRDVGYLPGDLRLYPAMTGLGLLRLFGRIRGIDLLARGRELAEKFELDLAGRVSDLSRGTQQKLGIILALAHEPRLAILDEPTNGLDPIMQERLKGHLQELAGRGHTIFFSSHALSTVEQLCERVAILRHGRLVADTTLEDLRTRAARDVRIAWRETMPALERCPEGLKLIAHEAGEWVGHWKGPVAPLLSWLADEGTPDVADLIVSPPDLEYLFQEYYWNHEHVEHGK